MTTNFFAYIYIYTTIVNEKLACTDIYAISPKELPNHIMTVFITSIFIVATFFKNKLFFKTFPIIRMKSHKV